MRTRVQHVRDERGTALVEFAVVLPMFCLVLFAIVQLGIVFTNYLALTDAVRTGARTAAVSRFATNPAAAAETAVRAAGVNLDQARLDVDVNAAASWQRGSTVTVSATYPYAVDLLGIVVANGYLESETTERVE